MKTKLVLFFIVMQLLVSACYWNDEIQPHEVGAQLEENAIKNCVGPGVYTDTGWFADLSKYSVATLTFEVSDPEVATSDNQLVGIVITIQARRNSDCDSVKAFLSNWAHLIDDNNLISTIDATAKEGLKNGARQFTLSQLLDDRDGLALAITEQLKEDALKYNTDIINVTIENVVIAPEYADVLQKTAQLKAEEDFQRRRQSLIEQQAKTDLFERQQAQLVLTEQLKVEQAQTEVEIEIARREGEKILVSYQVYLDNPAAYNLEMMLRLKDVFGAGTVYFIPEGTDLTTFFNTGGMLPIPQ